MNKAGLGGFLIPRPPNGSLQWKPRPRLSPANLAKSALLLAQRRSAERAMPNAAGSLLLDGRSVFGHDPEHPVAAADDTGRLALVIDVI